MSDSYKVYASEEYVDSKLGGMTEDEMIDFILEMDVLPVVLDENESIITDETGAILLI